MTRLLWIARVARVFAVFATIADAVAGITQTDPQPYAGLAYT